MPRSPPQKQISKTLWIVFQHKFSEHYFIICIYSCFVMNNMIMLDYLIIKALSIAFKGPVC